MKPARKILIFTAIALVVLAVILAVQRLGEPTPVETAADREPAAATPQTRPSATSRPPREADRQLLSEGARTDVSLTTFPIREYRHIKPPAGKAAGAPEGEVYIHVPSAGRRIAMEANQLGEFPAVETRLKETIGVRLQIPDVRPGDPVRIVILDGGTFPAAEGVAQVLEAADWRGVAFEYITSANIGTHRVLVQAANQPARILDFTAIAADES